MGHMTLFDPSDPFGIAIVVVGTIATVWTFVLAARMTIVPGEHEFDHPKHVVLREDR
jgi:hypothetical protein